MIDGFRAAGRRVLPLSLRAETIFDDDELAPEHSALRQEEYRRLHTSREHLSILQQQVLPMRFVHELRCADMATALGKREAAFRMLLSRTLSLLLSIYEQHEGSARSHVARDQKTNRFSF